MSKEKALSVIILFTLCFAVIAQVSAQTVNIGVAEGNWFRYKAIYYWNSTNPEDTVPANLVQQNQTEWLLATIKMVTGNTVSITELQHFNNGSEVSREEISSVGTVNQLSVLVYVAGLNQGDYLLPLSGIPDYKVNTTLTRDYAGGTRQTNFVENGLAGVDIDGDETIDYQYIFNQRYFDKQTGILVEGYFEYGSATNPGETYAYSYKLIESNVWNVAAPGSNGNGGDGDTPNSFFTAEVMYIIIIAVVVVAVSISLLLIRKRKS